MEQKVTYPQVGQTLASGYTVMANYDNRCVLAHSETAPDPYAVWDLDRDGDTVNGSYRSNLESAQRRFAERCFPWDCKPHVDKLVINVDADEAFDMLIHPSKAHEAMSQFIEKYGPLPSHITIDTGNSESTDWGKTDPVESPLYQPWDAGASKEEFQKLKNSPHVQALVQECRETGDTSRLEKFCKENKIYITEILGGF